jgi:hypothetical protein
MGSAHCETSWPSRHQSACPTKKWQKPCPLFSTETISTTLLIYKCVTNVIDINSVVKPGQSFCHFLVGHADWWRVDHMLPQWDSLWQGPPPSSDTLMDKFSAGRYSKISSNSSSRTTSIVILLTCISCTLNKHVNCHERTLFRYYLLSV